MYGEDYEGPQVTARVFYKKRTGSASGSKFAKVRAAPVLPDGLDINSIEWIRRVETAKSIPPMLAGHLAR
eukprot:g15808.t1